jgi:hypothetical protein
LSHQSADEGYIARKPVELRDSMRGRRVNVIASRRHPTRDPGFPSKLNMMTIGFQGNGISGARDQGAETTSAADRTSPGA